jgi:hypothetical protein
MVGWGQVLVCGLGDVPVAEHDDEYDEGLGGFERVHGGDGMD